MQGDFPLQEIWSYDTGELVETVSVTVNKIAIVQTSNSVLGLNSTGAFLWTAPIGGGVYPAPGASDGGDVFVANKQGVWALDEQTGKTIWNSPFPNPVEAHVLVLSQDSLFVNTASGSVIAYERSDGKIKWSVPASRGFDTANVQDHVVYVAGDGIKALDEATGTTLWTQGENPTSGSAYKNGILYYNDSELNIVALNTHQQYMAWVSELPNGTLNELTVTGSYVLVVSVSNLYVLKAQTGEIIWQAHTRGNNAVLMGDTVYLANTYSQSVTAFEAATGKELGSVKFGLPWALLHPTDTIDSRDGLMIVGYGRWVYLYGKR
jgi:outer membrane protein assembly factor BamB